MFKPPKLIGIVHASVAVPCLALLVFDLQAGDFLLSLAGGALLLLGVFNVMIMPFIPQKECSDLHSVRMGGFAAAGTYAAAFGASMFLIDSSVSFRLPLAIGILAIAIAAWLWLSYGRLIKAEPQPESA
jgi:hypothetical protein